MSEENETGRTYKRRLTKAETRIVIDALNDTLITNGDGYAVYPPGEDDQHMAERMREAGLTECTRNHIMNVRRSVFGGTRASALNTARKRRVPTQKQRVLPLPAAPSLPIKAGAPTLAEKVDALERRLAYLERELGITKS